MKKIILLAAMACCFLAARPVQASLISAEIHGKLLLPGDPNNFFDPANGQVPTGSNPNQPLAIVTEDDSSFVEFMFETGIGYTLDVDIDSTSIYLLQTTFMNTGNTYAGWTIELTDLDFVGGGSITGVEVVSSIPDLLAPIEASFSTDSVTIFNPGGTLGGQGSVSIQLKTSSVPEPTSFVAWSLLGGIGLVVRHRRHKRKGGVVHRSNSHGRGKGRGKGDKSNN